MLYLVRSDDLVDPATRRLVYLASLAPPPPPTSAGSTGLPTPLASRPPLPRLPDEIIAQIIHEIDIVTYDPTEGCWVEMEDDEEPWRELCACALTSRAFLPAARGRLYRKVAIAVGSDEDWDKASLSTSATNSFLEARPLERTLGLAPHLARLVRKVEIIYSADGRSERGVERAGRWSLSRILQTCPQVADVRIVCSGEFEDFNIPLSTEESLAIMQPLHTIAILRTLRLVGMNLAVDEATLAVVGLLRRGQSYLEDLDFTDTTWQEADVATWAAAPLELGKLDRLAFSTAHGTASAFDWITSTASHSLRHLSLELDEDMSEWSLERFDALVSLTWTIGSYVEPYVSEDAVKAMLALTKTVSATDIAFNIITECDELHKGLIKSLPSHIKSLHLPDLDQYQLDDLLRSQACPDLERLVVHDWEYKYDHAGGGKWAVLPPDWQRQVLEERGMQPFAPDLLQLEGKVFGTHANLGAVFGG